MLESPLQPRLEKYVAQLLTMALHLQARSEVSNGDLNVVSKVNAANSVV